MVLKGKTLGFPFSQGMSLHFVQAQALSEAEG
jgi:hypothetical protein